MLFDVFFHGKTRKISISLTNNYGSRTKNVKFSEKDFQTNININSAFRICIST